MKPANIILILILFLPLLFSCSSAAKLHATASSLPPLPESAVNIPLKIYIKPFLDKAETLIPLQFTSEQWPDYTQAGCDFRYKYRFIRSAWKFSCVNNQALITFAGNYQVAGSKSVCILGKQASPWVSGSCGFNNEAMRKVTISLRSALRFLPDYSLKSKSETERIDPVDKCAVTFFNTDITGMVMNSVRSSMNVFTATIDHEIAALNTSSYMRRIAQITGKKIDLKSYGYLSVNLSSVKAGKISSATDTLYLTAGFSCFPELSSDNTAGNAVKTSLPPLIHAEPDNGFTIYANAGYGYSSVSTLLSNAVKNKIFNIKGEKIIIDNIEVKGSENSLVEVRAGFSGSRKGVLYLAGTPTLDVNSQVISFPDLNFSLRSKSFVLNAGKTFFNKKILRAIRNQATIHINSLYQQNRMQLNNAFSHRFAKNIYSAGSTEKLFLTGMVIKKEQLLFQACVKGSVSITVAGN